MKRSPKKVVKKVSKPLANPTFNIFHEDLAPKIEKAFKSGLVQYYKFIEDHQIPAGRYKYIYAALKEADLRMDLATLQNYVGEIKKVLNGGDKKNLVSMETLWRITWNLENRISLGFEPVSIKRLAAVIYFDQTEDLKTYDKEHGMQKVQHWEKNKTLDFFLTRPIVELFGLRNISLTSLEESIHLSQGIIEDLTADLRSLSLESSSGNGKSL